jgi:hypothetical protein
MMREPHGRRSKEGAHLTQQALPVEPNENDRLILDEPADGKDEVVPYQYSITSYGADYTVDSLVKRLREDSIFVPPFQREFVWTIKEASRFVESLLLGLPVPGIFLSKEEETQRLLVIDGQQRLMSLRYFYEERWPEPEGVFRLKQVQDQFEGKTYGELPEPDRRRLDDSIIHATVVKQDVPSDDKSSIYHIFERINTGGRQLNDQEIRTSIFHGELADLLDELNEDKSWRAIYGPVSLRLRDRELILRFLALRFMSDKYNRPMKEFLNTFMGRHRHLKLVTGDEFRKSFGQVAQALATIGNQGLRPKRTLNAAVLDSVMVGLSRRLGSGAIQDDETLRAALAKLMADDKYQQACGRATADADRVKTRLDMATAAFRDAR